MKVRVKFAKEGAMKFIGHLDIMRYFQKAVKRAGLDAAFSEGYSPHMIMSFASPLGVGITSTGEYFDLELKSASSSEEMVKRLNDAMVEGLRILSMYSPFGREKSRQRTGRRKLRNLRPSHPSQS